MQPLAARCHLGLGELDQMSGMPVKAKAEITAAVRLFRSMEMTFWLSKAEAHLSAL